RATPTYRPRLPRDARDDLPWKRSLIWHEPRAIAIDRCARARHERARKRSVPEIGEVLLALPVLRFLGLPESFERPDLEPDCLAAQALGWPELSSISSAPGVLRIPSGVMTLPWRSTRAISPIA